jgi:putative endopeptidase
MIRHHLIRLIVASATLAGLASAQSADSLHYGAWGLDLSAMNRNVRPGDNFNDYASGTWLITTDIPPDKPGISLRSRITDVVNDRLHQLMDHAASAAPAQPATLADKVGAFYHAYLDTAHINELGASPITPALDAVRAATDRRALATLMGRTQTDFEGTIWVLSTDVDLKDVTHYALYIGQPTLGLPDRDYYLNPTFATQKAAYQVYVARLLTLINWPDADAKAADVVAFETRLADASWSRAEQRDPVKMYNPMTRAELDALTPGFPWGPFFESAGLPKLARVVVQQKSAFPRIAAVFADTPLDVLRAWSAFTVVDHAAFYLSAPFVDARFALRDRALQGQPQPEPRWLSAIHAVSGGDCGATGDRLDCFGNMGFGVGQLYTAVYFPPASKAAIEALVANVKAAMHDRLEHNDWMSPATKAEALKKLDTYQIKVGYPDHPRDYSGLVIRSDDLIGDVRRAAAWDWQFYLHRLPGPVDRSDWTMTPQTNDAYNGSLRDIVFPAAILQAPEFDPNADPAINYGATGFVIGHELTHGFDDEGRKLDASGALRDWWTPADAAAFDARAAKLGAQYSSYEPIPGVHINGALTMGENIADLGGLNVALEAYHRSLDNHPARVIDGFTGDQRFFLGEAQAWRGKVRDNYVRKQVVSDPHSPRAFRVIGPTRNIDAWYTAFNVQPSDHYYLSPDDRVRIW